MLRRFFSLILIAVFFIETLPDDLIHELSHHHDTVDHHSLTTAVGVKHIHCPALQLSLPAFSKSESLQISQQTILIREVFVSPTTLTFFYSLLSPSGRAPPALA